MTESKLCTKCKQELSLIEFSWKLKDVQYSSHCKECSRRSIKSHYYRNKQYYLIKAKRRNDFIKQTGYTFLKNYLLEHACVDCGETDILVLEFDHRSRDNKSGDVSRMLRVTGSVEKLKDEVYKCDVRCANCHRRKTAHESGNWKLLIASVAQRIEH